MKRFLLLALLAVPAFAQDSIIGSMTDRGTMLTTDEFWCEDSANTTAYNCTIDDVGTALGLGTDPIYGFDIKWEGLISTLTGAGTEAVSDGFFTEINGGTVGNGTPTAGHPGIGALGTSTSATGAAAVRSAPMIVLGDGTYTYEAVVRVPVLSDGSQDFIVVAGLADHTVASFAVVDGVYFRYNDGTISGEWEGNCTSNSVSTSVDSNTPVVADTWYRLGVNVNAAATLATFYINGSSVGTCSTNIPSGASRVTALGHGILKTLGTTARTFEIDYVRLRWVATTPR